MDFEKLREEQKKLSDKVSIIDNLKKYKTFGGVDQIVIGKNIISGIIVCDSSFKIIEEKYSSCEETMPYKSGFQFYREGISIMESFNKLQTKPDVLMIAGHGILHPRRLGIASHVGIILDIATIGIGKRLLTGEVRENTVYIDKEARGYQLKTKEHAKPIFISPGHNISLKTCSEIVKKTIKYPHKLPEPLHLAHKYANKIKINGFP